jgi:hypothetical protein
MNGRSDAERSHVQTTDGEIAVINLESTRGRSWSRFFADPVRTGSAEAVLEHEQLTAQFIGDVSALDRIELLVAELAKVDPASARTALIEAQAASMGHRFAEARRWLAQAEINGAPKTDIHRLRLGIDQACGANLDVVLEARCKFANESHGLPDQIALGSLFADLGDFTAADQTYREGLRAYQDVSPFPVAWTCFQLGMLWGEQIPEPDRSRAADWYRQGIDVLPSYTKARVHLAEIYVLSDRLSEAEALLFPVASSGDPEVHWRLADVTAALGKKRESEAHVEAARFGYDYLLARHLLAFADHGAEFYAGSGNDFRRALELARVNIANRPTLRALEQGYAIAVSGGEDSAASELLAAAKMCWGNTASFRQS